MQEPQPAPQPVAVPNDSDRNSSPELSMPGVMGALPADVIKSVIDANKHQIRDCYEIGLQKQPNLEGRVEVRWVVGASGAATKAEVRETTMNDGAVEGCITAKIRAWKFPAPSGGGIVEVNYPFVFRAG